MPLSLLLALRFLRSSGQEKNISVMIKICFFSIFIGTAALTLVAAIMNGFERATYRKLQGVHADITINAYDKAIDYQKLKKVLLTEYADTIQAVSPTSISQIILQSNSQEQPGFTICLLKAIDPQEEQRVSKLSTMITHSYNNEDPWKLLETDTIFIGQPLADQLHIAVGDYVSLLYPEDSQLGRKVSLEEKRVRVGAFFKTGIHDFDEHILVTSLALARKLFPLAISQVTIMLKDSRDEQMVLESLKKRLAPPDENPGLPDENAGLHVASWKDLYPSLVSALILEKYAILFVLILVTLVASLNSISLLFMYVTHKRTTLALLKTMGMTDRSLMSVFVIISAIITLTATLCGIALAAFATFLLNTFPFISLPDVYYVSHLPAVLNSQIVGCILVLAVVVSVVAALIPSSKIRSMIVAHILKSMA